MELLTKANGKMLCVKDMVLRLGQMEVNTKGSGRIIKQMARAFSITPMAMSIRENGSMTKLTVTGRILIQMGPSMLGSGRMISRMALEFSSGLMVRNIKDSTRMEVKLGKDYLNS